MKAVVGIAMATAILSVPVRAQAPVTSAKAAKMEPKWRSSVSLRRQGLGFNENAAVLDRTEYSDSRWREWITIDDMPADLRQTALSTETYVAIDVSPDGLVASCRVLKPSQDTRLDAIVCLRLQGNARFDPVYRAPGEPVAQKMNMAVIWSTRDITREPPGPPMMMSGGISPPKAGSPDYDDWPRRNWLANLVIKDFPDLQSAYPAGLRGAKGITGVDLIVTPTSARHECKIGASSGNPQLDLAACDVARSLKIAYPTLCSPCSTRRIPLQFVWAKKGSHIRVPLPREGSTPLTGAIPRDPRDPRTALTHKVQFPMQIIALNRDDFADIVDKSRNKDTVRLTVDHDEAGKITSCRVVLSSGNAAIDQRLCKLVQKRGRFTPVEDVFGNPIPGTSSPLFRIEDVL
jgi:hypothetical protein